MRYQEVPHVRYKDGRNKVKVDVVEVVAIQKSEKFDLMNGKDRKSDKSSR